MVRRLDPQDADQVVDLFCDSFADYPVMQHVLGSEAPDRPTRLRRLIRLFVMSRALRDEPMLVIDHEGSPAGAATISIPESGEEPPEISLLRESVWLDLGPEARERYEECGRAWEPIGLSVPQIHLNMIGVRRTAQGKGLARHLVSAVHQLCRETAGAEGVSLTTEVEQNVEIYHRMGYRIVGEGNIAPGIRTWSMFWSI